MIYVVAGMIFQGDKVLIAQREKNDLGALKWEFPGGQIEEGETRIKALERELKEELNLECVIGDFYYEHVHEYPDGKVTIYFYKIKDFHGKIKLTAHEEIKWIFPHDYPNYDFLDADIPVLKKLISEMKN